MKKSRFTEEQIAFALKQAETGTSTAEVLRRMGISEQTCLRGFLHSFWASIRLPGFSRVGSFVPSGPPLATPLLLPTSAPPALPRGAFWVVRAR